MGNDGREENWHIEALGDGRLVGISSEKVTSLRSDGMGQDVYDKFRRSKVVRVLNKQFYKNRCSFRNFQMDGLAGMDCDVVKS